MKYAFAVSLVCSSILFSCAVTATTVSAQPPRVSASLRQSLPNATYPVEATSTGKAHLKDGVFEESVAPGSAATIRILLGKEQVFGDLDGNGTEDAVVTLVVDPGGSGTFTYLALVLNEAGTARPLDAVFLGDRITLKAMAIQPGSVTVTFLSRKPDEPMSAEPTVELTRTITLQGEMLTEVTR